MFIEGAFRDYRGLRAFTRCSLLPYSPAMADKAGDKRKGGGKKTAKKRGKGGGAQAVKKKAGNAAKKAGAEAKKAGVEAKKKAAGVKEKAAEVKEKASAEAKKASAAAKKAKADAKKRAAEAAKKTKKAIKKLKKRNYADPALFAPLSEGERADALRILTEDKRLANMAKVGRYRVIAVQPFPTKPPNPLAGRRVVRVVAYDYASDRCVEATIDLDKSVVDTLSTSRSQPMLSIEEEDTAINVALASDEVKDKLQLGDIPLAAMHYWSWRETDLAYSRRSAAVLFGQHGARPSLVVVVDLLDNQIAEVVPGAHW